MYMKYISTRNNCEPVCSKQPLPRVWCRMAVICTANIPVLDAKDIAAMAGKSYQEMAKWILAQYLSDYQSR